MERATRETWAKRVERWGDSGLTAKEYAAELGISPHSLSWWKWRLSKPSLSPVRKRVGRAAKTPGVGPLTFVEVAAPAMAEPIEVVLPSSVRVRVPTSFDAATLGRLLDVLEERR